MRFVERRQPPQEIADQLRKWRAAAREAERQIVKSRSKVARKEGLKRLAQVYKNLKFYLLWLFGSRCSFCESLIIRYPGDVEHYRPKSEVAENPDHPGYYWLAFTLENLLLSCEDCNRLHKRTSFKIRGKYAIGPTHPLSREKPLLLNPCIDNPEEHLSFEVDQTKPTFGYALAISSRGAESIRIYGLNEGRLPAQRAEAIRNFLARVELDHTQKRPLSSWRSQLVDSDYGTAKKLALQAWVHDQRRRLSELDV